MRFNPHPTPPTKFFTYRTDQIKCQTYHVLDAMELQPGLNFEAEGGGAWNYGSPNRKNIIINKDLRHKNIK